MIRHLFCLAIAFCCCFCAEAQFRYTFKDTTTTYSALTGGTSVNGSTIWDEEDYSISMPFSWKMDSTYTLSYFNLSLSIGALMQNTSSFNDINGFFIGDFDLADRGNLTNTSTQSPVRYVVTGTSPNRIFKLELANAGFAGELAAYSTMSDYFNVQIWVYETSNIVEIHYGPSQITHPFDYFQLGGSGPWTGYFKHCDFISNSGGAIYYLTGSPSTPGIDTFLLPFGSSFPTNQLTGWPSSGTVYRYTPKVSGPVPCTLPKPTASFTQDTTIGRVVQFTYTGTTANLDSLVWNFGDGTMYKIAGNYTTPVSHIFQSNGRQNVCVYVYNRCQGDTSCAQTAALGVGGLSSLGNVRVYPNPASSNVFVDGLAGGKAIIYSVLGKEVMNAGISANHQAIDISALPAGSYTLMLTNEQGTTAATRFLRQ